MPEPLTCAGLASAVVAHPAPVVFLDTASILDVLRVPFRDKIQTDILHSAVPIASAALSDPRRVWLITTAVVIDELEVWRERVKSELIRELTEFQAKVSHISPIAARTFPDRKLGWPNLLELGFPQRVVEIMDHLIGSIVVFTATPDCLANAGNRVLVNAPPASRASNEFKDCVIFEAFLELVSSIRSEGFEPQAVFVTPNEKDYGKPPQGYPRIAGDLAAVRGQYAANLSRARALIGS